MDTSRFPLYSLDSSLDTSRFPLYSLDSLDSLVPPDSLDSLESSQNIITSLFSLDSTLDSSLDTARFTLERSGRAGPAEVCSTSTNMHNKATNNNVFMLK